MTDRFPVLAFSCPKISPLYSLEVIFEPIDYYNAVSCVFLFVNNLFRIDISSGIENWHILFCIESNRIVSLSLGLSHLGCFNHDLQELLLTHIVMIEDTL